MELLKEFPALWVVAGGMISGFFFWFINKNVFSLSKSASQQLTDTYREHITALTKERDDYRNRSHTLGNELNVLQVANKTLEAKPDLEHVFEEYKREADRRFKLYQEQSELLRKLTKSVDIIANHLNGKHP